MIFNQLKKIFLLTLLLNIYQNSLGQVIFPGDYTRDYYRLLMLKDTTLTDPISLNPSIITGYGTGQPLSWDIWNGKFIVPASESKRDFTVLDPRVELLYNSAINKGENDGAVWKGKGFNSSINFGITGRYGKLRYTIAPVVYYAQNKYFDIPADVSQTRGRSEFAYPFNHRIDWPQRFGDNAVGEIHPGQSEVRFVHKKFTIGVSTANMIWGPAKQNPIIMSTNAGGFPHLDIGSITPFKTKIGEVEFRSYWGILNESEYFDDDEDNQTRYIGGFTLGYRPKYIKGLNIGINRILYTDLSAGSLGVGDAFIPFLNFFINNPDSTGISKTNDLYDQIMSASIRWEFPEPGFEVYMEYAYNDFPGNFLDLIEQPDRTRGIVWGFTKTFNLNGDRLLKFSFEHTSLSKGRTQTTFPHSPYYVHGIVNQGYTERGQIIGASIGPGSNSDFIQLNYYTPSSRLSLHFQRTRFNDDFLFANFAYPDAIPTDYEANLGADYVKFVDNFSLNPFFMWTYRNNWFFNDDIETENWQFGFRLGYFMTRK